MKDTTYTIPAKHFDGEAYRCYFHKPQGRKPYVHSSLVTPTEHGFTKIMDFQKKRGEYYVYIEGRATDVKIKQAFAELWVMLSANDDISEDQKIIVSEVLK